MRKEDICLEDTGQETFVTSQRALHCLWIEKNTQCKDLQVSCSLSAKTWVAITLGWFRAAIPDICSCYSVEKGCAVTITLGHHTKTLESWKKMFRPFMKRQQSKFCFSKSKKFPRSWIWFSNSWILEAFQKRATHYQVWFYLLKSFIEQIIWCFQPQIVTFNIDPMSKKLLDELKRLFLYLFNSWIRRPWSDTLEE